MTIRFDMVGTCTGVATYRVEGYTPKETAHGSLDVCVAVCIDCHQTIRTQMDGVGMVPYSVSMVTDIRPCGERTVFQDCAYTDAHEGEPRTY